MKYLIAAIFWLLVTMPLFPIKTYKELEVMKAPQVCLEARREHYCADSVETLIWGIKQPDTVKDTKEDVKPLLEANKGLQKVVTAYNSVPEQTDDSPCISANNSNICELEAKGDHSCAAALPFGTKLHIPGFGNCTVRDRLAPKFAYRVDIHMGGANKIAVAKSWGKKNLLVSIIEP